MHPHALHMNLTRAQKRSLLRGRGVRVAHTACGYINNGHVLWLSRKASNKAIRAHGKGMPGWMLRPHEFHMERAHGEGFFDNVISLGKRVYEVAKKAAPHISKVAKAVAPVLDKIDNKYTKGASKVLGVTGNVADKLAGSGMGRKTGCGTSSGGTKAPSMSAIAGAGVHHKKHKHKRKAHMVKGSAAAKAYMAKLRAKRHKHH